MDISTITDVKELKALAFDQLQTRDVAERNLNAINVRLSQLEQEKQEKANAHMPKKDK